ncbi:MAG: Ribonuclease Y [candidate division WS2 bacterium]|nr:Ribonuclease Y [Candidatus Lithacetigena glycinireducens]
MDEISTLLLVSILVFVFVLSFVLGLSLANIHAIRRNKKLKQGTEAAYHEAQSILEKSKKESDTLKKEAILEGKEEAHKLISQAKREAKELQLEIQSREKRLLQKEDTLDKREKDVVSKEKETEREKLEAAETLKQAKQTLEKIANLTEDEAKRHLFSEVEKEIKIDAAKIIREYEIKIKEEVDRRAKEIITLAIQRCAFDQARETTVSVVSLPSDEMKGRLIGREGRNIKAFESLTGVDLIVDDTPEVVVISCFDPVRREIARLSLEKLILDGRIQPTRIEEIVEKARTEVDEKIKEVGEASALKVGISGLHPEIIKLLGRLQFRTSYGQNVLQNSIESALLAGMMAQELQVDTQLAKRAALLHDIGKAVSHETEGPHAIIGAELARKYKEGKGVVHAILAHHEDEEPLTIEAVLVQVADAISGGRPGARGDTLEQYMKRLRRLEEVVTTVSGVEKAYAIQSGREIRVIVKPEEVDDNLCALLARDIAKKIEQNLDYPGHIKVTVIRETRAIEYAK